MLKDDQLRGDNVFALHLTELGKSEERQESKSL